MAVEVIQPNPYINQPTAEQHNPISMFNGDVKVMPFGYVTVNKLTSGCVGKLNDEYIYPPYLFYDGGCGQTCMIFDQSLPDDWTETLEQIMSEPFNDPELDQFLPDLGEYDDNWDDQIAIDLYNTLIEQYLNSGIHDDYLSSLVIDDVTTHTHTHTKLRTIQRYIPYGRGPILPFNTAGSK